MKIYKTLFMGEDKVYQLHGITEQNIRESYTGGAVDVYIPHNAYLINGNVEYETLYCYDVNGLYPTVMANKSMPIGKPVVFEGDITKARCEAHFNPFGYFYAKITSPPYLEHPILQQRIKTSEGIRTIAGLGTWFGWIYSEEMYNAIKFGYQFKILKGYLFNKGILFNEFINKLYKLRMEYPKGTPMNQSAKLLQNSLYGKFGMKDIITIMQILENITPEDKDNINSILDIYSSNIIDIIDLENHTLLIRKSENNLNYNKIDDYYHGSEVNVAIASAITAEARIFMSQFKNDPNFKLYYSDTDSIFTNKPLPESMVGTALGQLKLEYTIKKAVFLAPKVYALITEDGKEIIKVKGLTNELISKLTFSDLEALLAKDSSKEFTQEKWFKSVIKGEITTNDMIYTLKSTSNKRMHIYENGIFNNTKPYNYDDIINPYAAGSDDVSDVHSTVDDVSFNLRDVAFYGSVVFFSFLFYNGPYQI